MKPKTFMLIAGEASGDMLAAELVNALRAEATDAEVWYTDEVQPLRTTLEPRFFGAGGPRMKAAGVELAFDMTEHSVIGLSDALKNYFKFKRLFDQLFQFTTECQPDAIICVDFSGFNRRFAHAIKNYVRTRRDWFHDWNPKIIQYVSPQVWASREGRAYQLARDFDLLLSIFPFEKQWYASRVPNLRVEFVGHPIIDRYAMVETLCRASQESCVAASKEATDSQQRVPTVLLLPGSRPDELRRHLPVMVEAARILKSKSQALFWMVLPNEESAAIAGSMAQVNVVRELGESEFDLNAHPYIRCTVGNLMEALTKATVAIASTGTVTMECAYFGVPTVAIYISSWSNYQIAKSLVKVKFLAMPNLLAGEEIFPEFIQNDATPENISHAALELMNSEERRHKVKTKLVEVVATLGGPGASTRAAKVIVELLTSERRATPGVVQKLAAVRTVPG